MSQTETRFGTIFKREALVTTTVQHGTCALILESKDPFPGYYCSSDDPADNSCKEQSYYLPVYSTGEIPEDRLCRLSLAVRRQFATQCCPARFTFNGKPTRGVRLKALDASQFGDVIQFFESHDLKFYNTKKVSTFLSQIYLKAFFEIDRLTDEIFQNQTNPDLYYLKISHELSWETFEKLITYQKTGSRNANFDAALGFWYEQPAFTDFIRIYGKDLEVDFLGNIRKTFLANLKSYDEKRIII